MPPGEPGSAYPMDVVTAGGGMPSGEVGSGSPLPIDVFKVPAPGAARFRRVSWLPSASLPLLALLILPTTPTELCVSVTINLPKCVEQGYHEPRRMCTCHRERECASVEERGGRR
jgi:hypothetical protein